MSAVTPPCPRCGGHHGGTNTRAVGRFQPDGPRGYVADYPGAPLRGTRDEAKADHCAWTAARRVSAS